MVLKVLIALGPIRGVAKRSALPLRPVSQSCLNRVIVVIRAFSKNRCVFAIRAAHLALNVKTDVLSLLCSEQVLGTVLSTCLLLHLLLP